MELAVRGIRENPIDRRCHIGVAQPIGRDMTDFKTFVQSFFKRYTENKFISYLITKNAYPSQTSKAFSVTKYRHETSQDRHLIDYPRECCRLLSYLQNPNLGWKSWLTREHAHILSWWSLGKEREQPPPLDRKKKRIIQGMAWKWRRAVPKSGLHNGKQNLYSISSNKCPPPSPCARYACIGRCASWCRSAGWGEWGQ